MPFFLDKQISGRQIFLDKSFELCNFTSIVKRKLIYPIEILRESFLSLQS